MMNKNILILCIISLCASNGMKAMNPPHLVASSPQYSLHKAAAQGNTEQVNQLIANKADINQPDDYGNTPLHEAVRSGNKAIAKILLNNNADVNQPDNNGNTLLYLAAHYGQEDIAKLLLRYVTDLQALNPQQIQNKQRRSILEKWIRQEIIHRQEIKTHRPDD